MVGFDRTVRTRRVAHVKNKSAYKVRAVPTLKTSIFQFCPETRRNARKIGLKGRFSGVQRKFNCSSPASFSLIEREDDDGQCTNRRKTGHILPQELM